MAFDQLSMQSIRDLDFPPLILYAIPVMLALVLVEWLVGTYKKRKLYEGKDFLSSAAIGVGNLLVDIAIKAGLLGVFIVFYNLSPLRIPYTWWSLLLAILVIDFTRYWAHRWGHELRLFWATHVTHHSSENYNLAVSFRLSWTQHIKFIFYIPAIMMGFHPVVFFIANQLGVLYQFWVHTELIKKLPAPIEYIFVTPSHHRVHHGRNPKYIDKNYGSTFIIWDRIFGTFQEEEEKVDYGITTPITSYNPVWLNFHEWKALVRDLKQARGIRDVFKILFGYPGTWKG